MTQITVTALVVFLAPILLVAGPPPVIDVPSVFPGEVIASSSSRWVGPYVLFQEVTIQGNRSSKVTWYARNGDILKEITGSRVECNSYYIRDYRVDTLLIHSIHDTSVIMLPKNELSRDGTIYGRDFGKHFYRQYPTDSGDYTDYYANGVFMGTHGPHCWITGRTFNVSVSGSFAYSVPDSTSDGFCRVVSADSSGNEVFAFQSDGLLIGITPSPTGELVVLNYNLDTINHRGSNDFACFFSSGKITRVNLYPNGGLVGWVPHTHKMIVATSLGADYTYHLLDWESGELVWSVDDPLEYTPMTNNYGVAVFRNYFILSGMAIRESIAHGPVIPNNLVGTIRMLAAIDINKGELVAKWYEPTFAGRWQVSTGMSPMPNRGGSLIWYDDELYHVTDVNFSKIDRSEIANLESGWVGPTDSGQVYRRVIY